MEFVRNILNINYTVGHKNSATLFSTITLAILEQFVRFLY